MKKYLASIITIIILSGLYFYMNPNPQKVIENHLKNKYKEEFIVEVLGKRDKKYEAIIYPKKYVGTSRENDSYYWGKGFAKGRKGGDTYGLVLLNESTNEFFLPKLKELFGENVLPALDMGPSYVKNNFKEEMEALKKAYKLYPTASFEPISGGIYIFGRVESDEDREWYRKQIYEFVQFMKETGTFEYVDIEFIISDDRIFSDEFYTNEKLQSEMKEYGNYIDSKGRKNILNKVNKSYEITNKNRVLERINNLNKSNIDSEFYGIYWLVTKIYSPKYIESKGWKDEKIKQYNKVSDIEFSVEGYNE